MKKNRHDVSQWKWMILRPMSEEVFLTVYTVLLDQKMLQLLLSVARRRAERKVARLVKTLPPHDKGAILLAKWEAEHDDNDFDPATDRLDEDCYCRGCGNLVTCCECD